MADRTLIQTDSAERVAYDLMQLILQNENAERSNPTDRAYYLELYGKCRQQVTGHAAMPI